MIHIKHFVKKNGLLGTTAWITLGAMLGTLAGTFLNPVEVSGKDHNVRTLESIHAVSYVETTDDVINPGRGFYRPKTTHFTVSDNTPDPYTTDLYHMRLDISQFAAAYNEEGVDKELSEDMLNTLDATFTNLEEHHSSAIVRFAYDPWFGGADTIHEPSIEMINRHQEQLGPVLSKHANCIVSVELGLFGKWGEMHSGDQCSQENFNKAIDKWLEVLPESIPISVRTPGYYADWANVERAKLNENITVKGTDAYRVGIYNDGYLGSSDDLDTYEDRDVELSWIRNQATHTLFGGEVVANDHSGDVTNTAAYMEQEAFITHTSYLNIEWNDSVINAMKKEDYSGPDPLYQGMTGFDYIRNHLGYRYVLRDVRLTKETTAKENFGIEADIENVGFGNIVKEKELQLILESNDHTYYFNTSDLKAEGEKDPSLNETVENNDPTAWYSKETVTFKAVCDLPDDMVLGDYRVYLRISDDKNSRGLNGYPVKFANADKKESTSDSNENPESIDGSDHATSGTVSIWNENLGANYLGDVTITDQTPAADDTSATPSLLPTDTPVTPSLLPANTSATPSLLPANTPATPSLLPANTSATPSLLPTITPGTLNHTETSESTASPDHEIKTGDVIETTSSNGKYQEKILITSVDIEKRTGTATLLLLRPKGKKLVVKDVYSYNGFTFKITKVADGACKNNKTITSILIGKNVTKIGNKAFYGARKCKTITIKSKKLTSKKIGKKAFGKIYKKVQVNVPKKKYKSYRHWLYKRGIPKKAKI